MAITIQSNLTANKFYPSQNPINVTVSSNNSGKCNFRYVCDLYVNGSKVFTDKLFPEPTTGYGFFQMSRVIQDYIKTTIRKTAYPLTFNAASSGSAPAAALTIQFKFGEEYDNTVGCTGTVNQYLNLATSATAYVFESAIDYEDFPTFSGNTYVLGTQSALTPFLTNSSKEIEVTYNDMYSLDFVSRLNINSSFQIRLIRYFNDGSTSTSYYASSGAGTVKRYRIACGPYDINNWTNANTINPFVNYYTVQVIWTYTSGMSTVRVNVSELFTFKVKDPKPFRTRIGFIGLKGSIEHFTFYHRKRTAYEIERKTFQKTLQSNYGGAWSYEVGDRGNSVYGVNAQEVNTVSSFCDKDTSEWLYEMWLSPEVWTYNRPDLYIMRPFKDGNYVKFWVEDTHDIATGDTIFSFSDNNDYNGRFTVSSVNGNVVDCGLLYSIYGSTMQGTCGWLQKDADYNILPIVISDNNVEVKKRTGRPIEYSLNWRPSYQKTTLRG